MVALCTEVDPGIYEVSIFKRQGVSLSFLGGPVSLKVERLRSNILTNPLANEHDAIIINHLQISLLN